MSYVADICFFIILIILFIQNGLDPRIFRFFSSGSPVIYLLNNTPVKIYYKAVFMFF